MYAIFSSAVFYQSGNGAATVRLQLRIVVAPKSFTNDLKDWKLQDLARWNLRIVLRTVFA